MIIPEESAPVSFVFGCPGFVFSCASSVLPFISLVVKFVWQMLARVDSSSCCTGMRMHAACPFQSLPASLRFLQCLGKGLAATESTCKEMKQLIVAGPVRQQFLHFFTVLTEL